MKSVEKVEQLNVKSQSEINWRKKAQFFWVFHFPSSPTPTTIFCCAIRLFSAKQNQAKVSTFESFNALN